MKHTTKPLLNVLGLSLVEALIVLRQGFPNIAKIKCRSLGLIPDTLNQSLLQKN